MYSHIMGMDDELWDILEESVVGLDRPEDFCRLRVFLVPQLLSAQIVPMTFVGSGSSYFGNFCQLDRPDEFCRLRVFLVRRLLSARIYPATFVSSECPDDFCQLRMSRRLLSAQGLLSLENFFGSNISILLFCFSLWRLIYRICPFNKVDV